MGNFTINCIRETLRKSCMIVNFDKIDQIDVKQARKKKNPIVVFLISLRFAKDLATIKSEFDEQFYKQLKQLIMVFSNVMEEPQGLPPDRGHLDHNMKLTSYPPLQQRNILSMSEYEELKRPCTKIFKGGKVRVSGIPYVALCFMVRKSYGSIRVCINYRAINARAVKD